MTSDAASPNPHPDASPAAPGPGELRDIAELLAAEAARLIRGMRADLGDDLAETARTKSNAVDPVTAVDEASERRIRELLAALRPGDAILGEEGGADAGTTGVRWIVDPVDGTVNFLYGIPAYAVSIAAESGGRVVAAAVADVPRGRVHSAALGQGARVREADGRSRALRASGADELATALVATGFSYDPARRSRQGRVAAELLGSVRDIRRIGSAAIDLCLLADGAIDAYYEHGLGEWDWAAGALIAEEAGAVVTRPERTASAEGHAVIAAAPGVRGAFAAALAGLGADAPMPAGDDGR
ncbi:inositol monophosphatase family protein [Corynebacterium sp. 335C]